MWVLHDTCTDFPIDEVRHVVVRAETGVNGTHGHQQTPYRFHDHDSIVTSNSGKEI